MDIGEARRAGPSTRRNTTICVPTANNDAGTTCQAQLVQDYLFAEGVYDRF